MKSPNASLTSCIRASFASVRKCRTLRPAVAMMLICPLVFAACQSTGSGQTRAPKSDNPYAKNDPRTPEEEEYYRDVYSGDWSEDSQSGLASVYKHSGSVTMPKHWQSMPPGAKTLEEIRFESSQRKMAEMRSMGRPLPTSSAPRMTAPVTNAPAPPSSPVAQPYASAQPAVQPRVYVQNPAPASVAATPNPAAQYPVQNTVAQSVAPMTAPQFVAQAPQFVAQAPNSSNLGQGVQFVAQAPAQPQTQPAPSQPASPVPAAVQTPVIQGPAAVYPQTQPQQAVYPSGNISASADILNVGEWIVRGQVINKADSSADDSDEDPFANGDEEEGDDSGEDPFANGDEEEGDDSGEDPFANGDEEEGDDSETEEVVADAQEEKVVEEQKKEEPSVKVSVDNVNVKSVAPEAKAAIPSIVGASGNASTETYSRGKKLPIEINPSIAGSYANVHRPVDAPAPEDKSQSRVKYDEYVVNGGDSHAQVISRKDWSVDNLDVEDSVVHFDTVDGRILTEPSNRVFLYSPRFGAVRQLVGPIEGDQREGVAIANTNEEAVQGEEIASADVRSQEIRPLGATGSEQPQGAETTVGITVSTGLQGALEGDSQIRLGAMLTSETVDGLSSEDASLMLDGAIAAQGWSGEQGVAVSTDLVNVFSNAYIDGAATIYQIKDDTKTSKLRVIKIANKDAAKPGEFVEFTLRFENIGDQPIGNVTILDNLSSRLRYVDGTAQSSVQADFLADLNEKGSLVLRWEIEKPLYPKEFGVVRFICEVQ